MNITASLTKQGHQVQLNQYKVSWQIKIIFNISILSSSQENSQCLLVAKMQLEDWQASLSPDWVLSLLTSPVSLPWI